MPDVILVLGPLSSRQSSSPGATERVNRAKADGVLTAKPRNRIAPCLRNISSTKASFSLYQDDNCACPPGPLPDSYSIRNGRLRSGSNTPVLIIVKFLWRYKRHKAQLHRLCCLCFFQH